MRRTLTVLLIAVLLVASVAPAADARGHGPGRGVIGFAAFVLFAPFIIAGEVLAHAVPRVVVEPARVYAPPVYQAPPVYYQAPPVYSYQAPPVYSAPPAYAHQTYAAPASAQPQVIQYPHGRYMLQGDGVVTPYKWVWIPNPPIPPPPAGRPPAPPA
jgi:hypothetical protein